MYFKSILREFRRSLTQWHIIGRLPRWAHRAKRRWLDSLDPAGAPYGMTKIFYGRNWIYKIYFKTTAQGQWKEIYYRKKRIY